MQTEMRGSGGEQAASGDRAPLHQERPSNGPKGFYMLLSTSVLVGLTAILVSKSYAVLSKGEQPQNEGGWQRDAEEKVLWDSPTCDIERVDASTLTPRDFTRIYRGQRPLLLTGPILSQWAAMHRWTRHSILERFGNRTIKAGIGSDIVNSGGGQGLATMTVAEFLSVLNSSSPDLFTFDVDFSTAMPELKEDFRTPDHFLSFNGELSRRQKQSWHMLSVGGSRMGLPFHVHGETWLGLVYGRKKWFLYPPGKGLTTMAQVGHHPLLSVWHWFKRVLPELKGEEKPLQCAQRAGEVMYLPPGWKHLTLNIGETVGVGGQAVYGADQRLRDCVRVLRANPEDFEAMLGAGLSLAHKALDTEGLSLAGRNQYFNQSMAHFRRATLLRPCQPEAHILAAEVLLAIDTEQAYAQARSIIHDGQRLYSNFSAPSCALPAYLGERERSATLAHVHLKFGRFFLQAGDGPEAERAFGMALKFMPTLAPAYADLSYVLAREGRTQEMEEAMIKATELAPTDLALKERLSHIRRTTLSTARPA